MATPANAVSTALIKGQREDLIDVIYNIDPYDTPFVSATPTGKADAIIHQWQTDELRAPGANAVIEGEDATINAGTFTTMLNNYCQISDETIQVTGTTDAVKKAGRKNELAYQLAKKGKELRMDIEYTMVGAPQAKLTRNSTTAGLCGNIFSYYTTNGSVGAGAGVAPVGDGSNVGTAGTPRALTEDILLAASQKILENGGKANTIHCGVKQKNLISKTFKGRATEVSLDASTSKVSTTVDVYETDWGMYKIVPNRHIAASVVFMFDPSMHSINYLRAFQQFPLAKTGDSEKRQLLAEYTLRVNNEKSGALIRDLS
jgi:hypothetical protein